MAAPGTVRSHVMRRVAFIDDYPVFFSGHPEVERLRAHCDVALFTTRAADEAELAARAAGAVAVVNLRAYTRITASLLDRLPGLGLIVVAGTGVDNVDIEAATARGVLVCNTPGLAARSVAEHAIALLLAVAKQLARTDREVREGGWIHRPGIELAGKTLGVVGLGPIGAATARMAAGLGMRTLAWTVRPDPARAEAVGATLVADLDRLLAEADAVSLHLRLSPESRGLLDARRIGLMKPGAILVNTARGALVDEAALAAALEAGRLRGAGLDVFVDEPLPADSPLRRLPTVVLSPHQAWVTEEASARLRAAPVELVLDFLYGRPVPALNRPAAAAGPAAGPPPGWGPLPCE